MPQAVFQLGSINSHNMLDVYSLLARFNRQFWTFLTYFTDVFTSVWTLTKTLATITKAKLIGTYTHTQTHTLNKSIVRRTSSLLNLRMSPISSPRSVVKRFCQRRLSDRTSRDCCDFFFAMTSSVTHRFWSSSSLSSTPRVCLRYRLFAWRLIL